jgi:hypothetical protein
MLDVKFWKENFQAANFFKKLNKHIFLNLIQKQFAGYVPEKKPYFDFKCCGMQILYNF